MTRRKRSTQKRSTRKRSTQKRSKRSTRGGARAKSERPSFHTSFHKTRKTQKLKYAHKGVFHTMTPRTTHRFASGRDARRFLKNRYKHEKYLHMGEAAARSIAHALKKQKKIANSVSSGPMAGVTMSEEEHEALYRKASEEHAAKEINNLAKAFGHASLSASSVAGEPYRMNPSHTSSYVPSNKRAKEAAASAAQQLQSMRLGKK